MKVIDWKETAEEQSVAIDILKAHIAELIEDTRKSIYEVSNQIEKETWRRNTYRFGKMGCRKRIIWNNRHQILQSYKIIQKTHFVRITEWISMAGIISVF